MNGPDGGWGAARAFFDFNAPTGGVGMGLRLKRGTG